MITKDVNGNSIKEKNVWEQNFLAYKPNQGHGHRSRIFFLLIIMASSDITMSITVSLSKIHEVCGGKKENTQLPIRWQIPNNLSILDGR